MAFGCSFIYGTDLSDAKEPFCPSQRTWPALLAKKCDLRYECYAGGGIGNLAILDRLSQQVVENPTAFFVVQWTYIDRFDYSDHYGQHYTPGINDWCTIRPNAKTKESDFYFRSLHSEYKDKLTSILYVKSALDLLQQNRCKFIMTYLDRLLLCDTWHCSSAMMAWQNDIKKHLINFDGEDFLTWSRQRGYDINERNHPLEQAHQQAAELMLPAIESILRRV